MKIIISHDIDHINYTEHYKDLIIPKYLVRSIIELVKKQISINECFRRFFNIFKIRFNRVKEIAEFNKKHGVKETYFIGVNNGLGLVYSIKSMKKMSNYLKSKKLDFGVHGIAFNSEKAVQKEFDTFKAITKINKFGIRMHYLRQNENTFNFFNNVGYEFDSTDYGIKKPYKIKNIWEFPIQIMDSYLMCEDKAFQTRSLEEAKKETLRIIKQAEQNNLPYFSLLFHDIYFDPAFSTWYEWYKWVIIYFKEGNYEFISYKNAVRELNSK